MVSLQTVFSAVIIWLLLSYYLTTHNNTPADNHSSSNTNRSRDGKGDTSSNNAAMYGDATKPNGEFTNGNFCCYFYSLILMPSVI